MHASITRQNHIAGSRSKYDIRSTVYGLTFSKIFHLIMLDLITLLGRARRETVSLAKPMLNLWPLTNYMYELYKAARNTRYLFSKERAPFLPGKNHSFIVFLGYGTSNVFWDKKFCRDTRTQSTTVMEKHMQT